jgi:hypothetical protein
MDFFSNIADKVGDVAGGVAGAAFNVGGSVAGGAAKVGSGFGNTIAKEFTKIGGKGIDVFTKVGGGAYSGVKNTAGGLTGGKSDFLFDTVESGIKNIPGITSSGAKTIKPNFQLSGKINDIPDVISTSNAVIAKTGGWLTNPELPKVPDAPFSLKDIQNSSTPPAMTKNSIIDDVLKIIPIDIPKLPIPKLPIPKLPIPDLPKLTDIPIISDLPKIPDIAKDGINGVKDTAKDGINGVKDTVKDVVNGVKDVANKGFDFLSSPILLIGGAAVLLIVLDKK